MPHWECDRTSLFGTGSSGGPFLLELMGGEVSLKLKITYYKHIVTQVITIFDENSLSQSKCNKLFLNHLTL